MGTLKGHLYLLLSTVFFSSSILCISEVIPYIPTFQLNALRFILGGMLLLIVSKGMPYKKLSRRAYGYSLLRGLFGIALYYLLETAALRYISSSMVSILVCLCYIVEVLYSGATGSKVLDRKTVVTLSCTLLGILFICMAEGNQQQGKEIGIGIMLMLLASISWVVYIHLEKTKNQQLETAQVVGLDMLMGGLCILPFVIGEQGIRWMELSYTTYVQLIYLAICPSALAYLFYNKGSKWMQTEVCSLYMNLIPVISLVMIAVLTEHSLSGMQWIGIFLVAGPLLGTGAKRSVKEI